MSWDIPVTRDIPLGTSIAGVDGPSGGRCGLKNRRSFISEIRVALSSRMWCRTVMMFNLFRLGVASDRAKLA